MQLVGAQAFRVYSLFLCLHSSISLSFAAGKPLAVVATPLFDETARECIQDQIGRGRVYQQEHFLTESEVQRVLEEIETFKEDFRRSGLSNTVQENQGFGSNDRSVCAVPWWKDALLQPTQPPHTIATKLNQIRLELAECLDRPTMCDATLDHECYYSVSRPGSSLKRHMDERHEELKGPKGWLLPSRRSLSWLVYMSDDKWTLADNGGALRTFPQAKSTAFVPPQHEGNLQVGWLLDPSVPVYLNCWYMSGDKHEPQNILYSVDEKGEQVILTKMFPSSVAQGQSLSEFLHKERSTVFLSDDLAQRFALFENRELWDSDGSPEGSEIVDIVPARGSLVVFDSVLLPHQVEAILKGRRVALAGWFHEATQQIPEMI